MKSKLTNRIISLSGLLSAFPPSFGITSYLLCLFFLYCGSAAAQPPVLLEAQYYSAIGAGASGVPVINFNIPAGTNRMMVISAVFERYHSSSNTNWPLGTAATPFNNLAVSIGGVAASNLAGGGATMNGTFSLSTSLTYLSDAGGLPTGNTAIAFPNLKLPLSAGDEMSVIVSVYENATSIISGGNNQYVTSNTDLHVNDVPVIPAGYTSANVLYLGSAAITESTLINTGQSYWTIPATMYSQVVNSGGVRASPMDPTEPDGLTHYMAYGAGAGAGTLFTMKKTTGAAGNYIASLFSFALLSPAAPAISGNVYKDITGPTTIEGVGTDAGGTYINVMNEGNFVVYAAVVNASGAFSVPGNFIIPNSNYKLEISKNAGTVGQPAPLKELNSGWTTVGESAPGPVGSFPNSSDGTNDGTINVVATASPITGLRFGVNDCPATLSESIFTKTDALNSLKTDGSITLSGLTPATVYTVSYRFDQVPQRALTFTPGSGGTWTITGFTPGEYSHFSIRNTSAGCTSSAPVTFSLSIN